MGRPPADEEASLASARSRPPSRLMPPELIQLLVPPLKMGAVSGTLGAMAGVGLAISRNWPPLVSGAVFAWESFCLGTSYWYSRTAIIRALGGDQNLRPVDKVAVSGLAGSAAGAVVGLIRGHARGIPQAIGFFTVAGAGGQLAVNGAAALRPRLEETAGRWSGKLSNWTPIRKMTDDEFVEMMGEKMIRVEAEIALVDEQIAELSAKEATMKEQGQDGGEPAGAAGSRAEGG